MFLLRPFVVVALAFLAPIAAAQIPQGGDTTSPPVPGSGHDYLQSQVDTVSIYDCVNWVVAFSFGSSI